PRAYDALRCDCPFSVFAVASKVCLQPLFLGFEGGEAAQHFFDFALQSVEDLGVVHSVLSSPSSKLAERYPKTRNELVSDAADLAVDVVLLQGLLRRAEEQADRRLDTALAGARALVAVHDADRFEIGR